MLFPKPKHLTHTGKTAVWQSLRAEGVNVALFAEAALLMGFETTESPKANVKLTVDASIPGNDGYRITVTDDGAVLVGQSEDAVARGIWTLLELIEKTDAGYVLPCCEIADEAYMQMRGVHLYVPAADEIDECKRALAAIAKLKYNAVILEIGGGMQYDRHPEINLAWVKFCRHAREHVAGPQGIQGSEAYWKDSTHVELSGGGYISKAQMRELVDYCRLLRLEVIPEMQALSHAYYLTMADKSIAERPFEPFPDSYCPSNERSYELYFDCAEEVIEVVNPKRVSIGHDEVRVLGECPLCRQKSGEELLAGEINRLHAFYKKHGITIMMWGEKLQDFMNFKGFRMGGVEEGPFQDRYGRGYYMPATKDAADMVPKDILMLDWYYSWGEQTEDGFAEKGFREIYGNFVGSKTANFDIRSKKPNVLGAEVSTWCLPDNRELEMNGRYYEMAFSSSVLWQDDYSDENREAYQRVAEGYLPELHDFVNSKSAFDGTLSTLDKFVLADKSDAEVTPTAHQTSLGDDVAKALAANGLGETEDLALDAAADSLIFFHAATNEPKSREYTWFFLDPKTRMGESYTVEYDDGLVIRIPILFPTMVGCYTSDGGWKRPMGDEYVSNDVENLTKAVVRKESPMFEPTDIWRDATAYCCRVGSFHTADGVRSVYAYEWKNPRPEHKILRIRAVDEGCSAIDMHLFAVGTTK